MTSAFVVRQVGIEGLRSTWRLSWLGLIAVASGTAGWAGHGLSQDVAAAATTVAWQVGDCVVYDVEKTRTRTVRGETTRHAARMVVEVRVIAADRDGYRIAWTNEEVVFDDAASARDLVEAGLGDVMRAQEVVLACGSDGIPQTVVNWRELQERHAASVEMLRKRLVKIGLKEAEADAMVAQARRLFDSEESIRVFCLGGASLVFLPYSFDFSEGNVIEFADRLPNPSGGELLPVTSRMVLTQSADAVAPVTLKWTQVLDAEKGGRIVQKSLGLATSPAQGIDFSMRDEATFVMAQTRGWMDQVDHARTVESDGARDVNTTRFVRRQSPRSRK